MLILKGILLAISFFVIAVLVFWYWATPQGARFSPFSFDVRFLHQAGSFAAGFGLGMLLIGTGLLWLGKISTAHLLSHIPK
jgi:hypothetical protein